MTGHAQVSGDTVHSSISEATVLVVDDDPDIVELNGRLLGDRYEVRKAYSGRECLEQLDADVDVVLLDRRMPDLSGREVLREIRSREFDCMVGMITAVRPALDIVDMEFDAYLVKPIGKSELHEVVDNLLLRADYSDSFKELMSTTWKLGALRAEHDERDLRDAEEYAALKRRERELRKRNEDRFADLVERVDTQLIYKDILGEP